MRAGVQTAPLVAREAVLEQLWGAVTASVETGMGTVVVHGPAGIGKTRVLEAFAERARSQGATVISGRSPAVGGHAYAALADMLGGWVRATPVAAGQLRRGGDALARLVPAVAATVAGDDSGSPEGLAVVVAAYRLVKEITDHRPLVLVLDDAHAADPESCEVLAGLHRHAGTLPCTLVLGWRDPAPEGVARLLVADLRRQRQLTEVGLEPLNAVSTGGLVAALLGEGLPAATLVAMIHQRTAGNPYYIEEMTRWLRETGRLRRAGLQWLHAPGCEHELPPSIEEAIGERIRALPVSSRSVLEWLSVLGGRADLTLLEAVVPDERLVLAEALDQLVASGMVRDPGLRGVEYQVHHPLVAECAYHEMGAARRRLCHRALARIHADRGAPADVVATHATRGADLGDEAAVEAAMRAGTEAESGWQYARAVGWYRQALRLVGEGEHPLRHNALDRLSELAAHVGDLELGLKAINELLARGDASDRVTRATLLRRLAVLRGLTGDIAGARRAIEEGLALVSAGKGGASELLAELASVATVSLPVDEALEIIRHGRAIAMSEGPQARASALVLGSFEAIALAHEGQPRQAFELAEQLAREAATESLVIPFGYAAFACAMANLVMGNFEDTESSLAQFLRFVTDEIGVMWGAGWGWSLYAEALLCLGRTDAAWDAVLRAEELARRHAAAVLPLPLVTGAMILAARDDLAAARERLDEARTFLDQGPNTICEAWYWAASAMVSAAEGNVTKAIASFETAWSRTTTLKNGSFSVFWRPGHALALLVSGRVAEALALAEELAEDLGDQEPLGAPGAIVAVAVAQARGGDVDWARINAERAVALGSDMQGDLFPAVVQMWAGEAMARVGETARARELLGDAQMRFERMGMHGLIRHLSGLCAALGIDRPTKRAAAGSPVELDPFDTLSRREQQVIDLAGSGLSSRAIGLRLGISERTVENHLARIYAKLDLHSRAELIAAHAARRHASSPSGSPLRTVS